MVDLGWTKVDMGLQFCSKNLRPLTPIVLPPVPPVALPSPSQIATGPHPMARKEAKPLETQAFPWIQHPIGTPWHYI
jgi:hypothetical protein